MAEYAKDAAETDKPWKRWEWYQDGAWSPCSGPLSWFVNVDYRRKPRPILINGFQVPEPMRDEPEEGTPYYVVSMSGIYLSTLKYWVLGDLNCRTYLARGFCHTTAEAAGLHARALQSFTSAESDQ